VTGSIAIGGLDGAGDTQLDIVVNTGQYSSPGDHDSLYVFKANGGRRAGFPVFVNVERIQQGAVARARRT
jgi:hypothetical protein